MGRGTKNGMADVAERMAEGRTRREIERKFLMLLPAAVIEENAREAGTLEAVKLIEQRYLGDTGGWTIRVRRTTILTDSDRVEHHLTFKYKISAITCIEIETPISPEVHDELAACSGHAIRKRRSCIRFDGFLWEVDHFLNPELQGIEVAEIELPAEDTPFSRPSWIGSEVTHLKRYKNARMQGRLRQ